MVAWALGQVPALTLQINPAASQGRKLVSETESARVPRGQGEASYRFSENRFIPSMPANLVDVCQGGGDW